MTPPSYIRRIVAATALLAGAAFAQEQIPQGDLTPSAGSLHSAPFPGSNLVDDLTLEGLTNVGDAERPPQPPQKSVPGS